MKRSVVGFGLFTVGHSLLTSYLTMRAFSSALRGLSSDLVVTPTASEAVVRAAAAVLRFPFAEILTDRVFDGGGSGFLIACLLNSAFWAVVLNHVREQWLTRRARLMTGLY